MKIIKILLIFLVVFGFQNLAVAQDSDNSAEHSNSSLQIGVGFQRITWNCWGLSAIVDLSPSLSVEGLLGLVGDRHANGLRGLVRFLKKDQINGYGYVLIGAETTEEYSGSYIVKETGMVVGGGVGAEYNLPVSRALVVSFNAELGVENMSGFEVIDANYFTVTYAAGIHLRLRLN